jgi:hypothetical protein
MDLLIAASIPSENMKGPRDAGLFAYSNMRLFAYGKSLRRLKKPSGTQFVRSGCRRISGASHG